LLTRTGKRGIRGSNARISLFGVGHGGLEPLNWCRAIANKNGIARRARALGLGGIEIGLCLFGRSRCRGCAHALAGARADLDKTVVRAPIDGMILKVNVRLGEYAQAGVLANPLMTMGSADPLHIRADVDEADSWRIDAKSPAIARLRGNPAISAPLNFIRFEPYVLPKRSLSGDNTERVDTRVLQVIYAFAPKDFPAFVGQQVDIFIKAAARGEVLGRVAMDAHSHSTADADLKECAASRQPAKDTGIWNVRRVTESVSAFAR
jgi:HlyD family secretion protein